MLMTKTILTFPPRESSPVIPANIHYSNAPLDALPFVGDINGRHCKWCVSPHDDYFVACDTGRVYAAHFAQFLKANPWLAGGNTLGHIAADIDFADRTRLGYWVGFFSYIEHLLVDGVTDRPVFDDLAAFGSDRLLADTLLQRPL